MSERPFLPSSSLIIFIVLCLFFCNLRKFVFLEFSFLASFFFNLLSTFVVFLFVVIFLLASLELLLLFFAVVLLIFLLALGSVLSFDFLLLSVFTVIFRGGSFDVLLFLSVILLESTFNLSFLLEFSLYFT